MYVVNTMSSNYACAYTHVYLQVLITRCTLYTGCVCRFEEHVAAGRALRRNARDAEACCRECDASVQLPLTAYHM